VWVCRAGGAGEELGTPLGHHLLPGRQGLLQQTGEEGCSRFPPASQGSVPTSLRVAPDLHKPRTQGSGDFAVKVSWVRAGRGAELCCSPPGRTAEPLCASIAGSDSEPLPKTNGLGSKRSSGVGTAKPGTQEVVWQDVSTFRNK